MDISPVDEELVGFGVKRTSEDKLTYKNIIADAINWCRKTKGSMVFIEAVGGLEQIIKFNVPGYKFIEEINNIKDKLTIEKKQRRDREARRQGRNFYGNAEQARYKLDESKWYWNAYFESIIQLLAEHNLLIDTEKLTKIKIKREIDEDESESNGSISNLYEE